MAARSKARKRAVDVLYEAALRDGDVMATLRDRLAQAEPPVPEYAVELVEGVVAHRDADRRAADHLLRGLDARADARRSTSPCCGSGTFELLWCDDVPDEVVISEAVDLVASLSTDESPGFVNGLLARLQQLKPSLAV